MVHSFRHALHGLAAFLGVILVGAVLAQANPSPTLVGVQARGPVSGGLSVMATFRAMPGSGAANAAFYSVPATLSPSTVGGLARGVMSRAAPVVAVAAVVAAAGWFINEAGNQVMQGDPVGPPIQPGEGFWVPQVTQGGQARRFTSAAAAARHMQSVFADGMHWQLINPASNCTAPDAQGSRRCTAEWSRPTGPNAGSNVRLDNWYRVNVGTTPLPLNPWSAPVPDEQLGNAIIAAPQAWPGVLTNMDGSPVRAPEIVTAGAALGAQLSAGTAPSQSNGWDTGFQGGEPQPQPQPQPNPNPTPQPQPVEIEFPVFCEWATTVCEFIDWMREEPPVDDAPELPVEDIEALRVPWSSGLGAGSCPSVAPVALGDFGEVSFPVDVMCDLGNLLRPVVILLASLIAVFIIVGGARAP